MRFAKYTLYNPGLSSHSYISMHLAVNRSSCIFRLTAFVVRSFARVRNYIFVDDKHIKDSVKWFESKQLNSGCFPDYGKVFDRGLQVRIKILKMAPYLVHRIINLVPPGRS